MDKASLFERLNKHFSSDPARLPVVQQDIELYERPNLHLAFEELFSAEGCESELVGIIEFDYEASLARLSRESSAEQFDEGPVEFSDVALAKGDKLACVNRGFYVFKDDGLPAVMLDFDDRI